MKRRTAFIFATLFLCFAYYSYSQDKIMVLIEGEEEKKQAVIAPKKPETQIIVKKQDPKKTKAMLKDMMDERMLDVESQLMKRRIDDIEKRSGIFDIVHSSLILLLIIMMGVLIRKKK